MNKKRLVLASILAASVVIGASASDLPRGKQSIGIVGGVSKTDDNSKGVYGISHKSEARFGDSSFYWGLGGDILYSDKGDINGASDAKQLSVGVYPTIGYGITKDLSANVMLGGAYDVLFYKKGGDSDNQSKFGLLYGASVDYQLTESISTGLVYRHTNHKFDDVSSDKQKNNSYMVRVAYSF